MQRWAVVIGVLFAAVFSLIGLVLANQDTIKSNGDRTVHNTGLINTHNVEDLAFQCVQLQAELEVVGDDPPSPQKDHAVALLTSLFRASCPQP